MGESLPRSPVQTERSKIWSSIQIIVNIKRLYCNKTNAFLWRVRHKKYILYYYITILYINQAIKPINNQSENTSE